MTAGSSLTPQSHPLDERIIAFGRAAGERSMDEALLGKAGSIERCLMRIAEEYRGHEAELASNFTRQDAIILNLQRACEAGSDAAMHLVRMHRPGIPSESRQAFAMLRQAGLLENALVQRLEKMVGFHIIAAHNDRELDIEIVRHILDARPGDLKDFAACMAQAGLGDRPEAPR